MRMTVLVGFITVPFIAFLFLVIILFSRYKVQHADAVWKIDFADLLFPDPPEVLGRGAFGLVVGAEYRTTNVAIKRMLPASSKNKKKFTLLYTVGSGVGSSQLNIDSMAMAGVGQSSERSGSEIEPLPMPSGSCNASFGERANTWTRSQRNLFQNLTPGSNDEENSHRGSIRSDSASSHTQPEENLGNKTLANISSNRSILQRILPSFFSEGRDQRASFIEEMRLLSRLRTRALLQ